MVCNYYHSSNSYPVTPPILMQVWLSCEHNNFTVTLSFNQVPIRAIHPGAFDASQISVRSFPVIRTLLQQTSISTPSLQLSLWNLCSQVFGIGAILQLRFFGSPVVCQADLSEFVLPFSFMSLPKGSPREATKFQQVPDDTWRS